MPPAIVARIRESEPVRRQLNKFGPGVTPAWDSENHVAVIEFDSVTFTREMAETWLHDHKFAEATIEDSIRTFAYPFTDLGGKFEKTPEGGLRVKGVKLLAAGTWTDSNKKTPCEYSTDVLETYAKNWYDYSIWSRHFGGVPRNITEKVGLVEDPRYENEAVIGDLFYHGLTQQSKDTISMIEAGLANYVSVETSVKDRWNVGKKVYQAQELGFIGLATVNQGACRVCKIRDNEATVPEDKTDNEADMAETPRDNEIVSEEGSLESLKTKIRDGLAQKLNKTDNQYLSIIATKPDQVIYDFSDYSSQTEQKFRIPYRIENDQVVFGDPVEVTVVYQDTNPEKAGAFEGKRTENMEDTELEARIEAVKTELKGSYDAKITALEADLTTLKTKLTESETQNKELAAELEKLKKKPDPKSLGLTGAGAVTELELSPYRVVHENGTVRRV